jgi:hypothetical protein
LLERTKESFVVLAQNVIRRIPKRLQAFLSLLLGRGVALPGNNTLGMSFFRYGTPLLFFLKDSRHFAGIGRRRPGAVAVVQERGLQC